MKILDQVFFLLRNIESSFCCRTETWSSLFGSLVSDIQFLKQMIEKWARNFIRTLYFRAAMRWILFFKSHRSTMESFYDYFRDFRINYRIFHPRISTIVIAKKNTQVFFKASVPVLTVPKKLTFWPIESRIAIFSESCYFATKQDPLAYFKATGPSWIFHENELLILRT